MMTTIHEVYETVRDARAEGPDALAAMALSFGATMVLGVVRCRALRGQIAEMRAALEATEATEATVATLRAERDAASAAAKAARQRMEEVREQRDRALDDAEMCARQRDEARSRASILAQDLARAAAQEREALSLRLSAAERERDEAREALAAQDSAPDLDYPARAEVWKLREVVEAHRTRAEKAEADRDRAVQEREAFSLRLSAAERERDEAREALDISRESAREAREEIAGALALVDEAREAIISELSQTTDAMMQARAERDAALARPTYEARTVAPTGAECDVHQKAGGRWLRAWHRPSTGTYCVSITHLHRTESVEHLDGATWIPLGADGLPCAWPVPSAEVTP